MTPRRILIHSAAPWEPTGYGTQTALLGRWLSKQGHQVIYSARSSLFYQVAAYENCPVLPTVPFLGDGWQDEALPGHIAYHKPDVVIVLYDLWNLGLTPDRFLGVPVLYWAPIDHGLPGHPSLGPKEQAFLASGKFYPVAMSEYGQTLLREAGFACGYVPHSIQTNYWTPLTSAREEIREGFGLPADAFVVGINATSVDTRRKGLYEQIAAFGQFHADHPEAVLMMHTLSDFTWGADVNAMCRERLIPPDAVRITPGYQYLMGMPADTMVAWYNACDVVSNATYGEGFGLAAIEAQACGTPVILSDGSTGPQLVGPGWLVKTQVAWNETHRSAWHTPIIGSKRQPGTLVHAYHQAWKDARNRRKDAWQFAATYEWETVSPRWDALLSEVLGDE